MPIFRFRSLTALVLTAMVTGLPASAQTQTQFQAQTDGDAGAYLASRVAGNSSDYRAAAQWYARALLADPRNPVLLEGLILSQVSLGEFAGAADAARQLVETGQSSPAASIALLVADAEAQDFPAILDAGARRSVGALLDGLVAAWAEVGTGKMSEALARFDEIAASPGLEAFGLYHKALALASVGDMESADEIMSGRAAGPLVMMRRGVIAHIQILSQLERPADALALVDQAFGAEPDPRSDALRARLTAGGPLPFDMVTGSAQGIGEVFFTLATALNGEADDSYTLLYSRVAAHLNPGNTDARLLSAGLLEQQRQPELAGEVYAQIAPDAPDFHIAEIGRADTLMALDRQDEAIAVLETLTQSHGGLIVVQTALGDALRRMERYDEAIVAYDAAVGLLPALTERHWSLFFARGNSNERAGNWDAAEADLRQALALNPDQPQVLNYLGYSFVDKGENLEEALGMIERAVAARPDAGYIIDSLAWAFYRLGRYDEALAPMERASVLEPVDPVVTDHLGDVYWAVGRRLEAQFQWRRALSFEPKETDAIRIRRKLEVGLDAVLAEEGAPPLDAVANGN